MTEEAPNRGSVLRSVLALVVGILVMAIVVAVCEPVGHWLFPPPPGLDPSNPESMKTFIDQLPLGALISVLVAWSFGTLVGAWLAARIARRAPLVHGMIIGILVLGTALVPMLIIPHPPWFWIAAIVALPTAAYAGARLAMPGKATQAPAAADV